MSKPKPALKTVTEKLIFDRVYLHESAHGVDVYLEQPHQLTTGDIDEAKERLRAHQYAGKMIDDILLALWETPAGKAMIQKIGYWNPDSITHQEQPA